MYNYVHGGDIYSEEILAKGEIIDFSVNINPWGLPKSVKTALRAVINDCSDYPDPFSRKLTNSLASYYNLDPQHILFSNGAADVLFKLALAIKPQKVLLLAPTFADYEKAFKVCGAEFSYYNLQEKERFIIQEDILDLIVPGLEMVVICNPNNPTGKIIDQGILKKILEKCQNTGTYLLIDECFMEFVNQENAYSFMEYLNEYKNLIIVKAFTKTYAMAGVRLGYCLSSNTNILEACHENGQDWSVSTLAQAAGMAALADKEYLAKSLPYIRTERDFLLKKLTKLGFETFEAQANYIFFKSPILNLAEKLKAKGIIIRSCANYRNLTADYFRVGVRTKKENRILIKTLRDITKYEITNGNN